MEKKALIPLVKAAQTGDSDATAKLFDATYQDIYYFILKTVKEKELAEDLTQDTFIKILTKLSELQTPEAFIPWSRQIAQHSCTDYFRKRKEFLLDEYEDGSTVFDTLPEEDVEFIPHEALDREDLKQTLLDMLDTLPPEQRSAMLLRYYDELPVSQIAQVQQVSEGTVKSRLNYGRKAIAKCVEDYEKKNGVKLHSVAILPLLLWLLRKQKLSSGVSVTGGVTAGTAVAATVAAGAKTAVVAGAKAALGAKLAAMGAVVVTLAAGIVLTVTLLTNPDTPSTKPAPSKAPTASAAVSDTLPVTGDYQPLAVQLRGNDAIVYTKDQHIFYYGEQGPVQLTTYGLSDLQISSWMLPEVLFSRDMRYVCYPDNFTQPANEDSTYSCEYYYRDLLDPDFQPICLGRDVSLKMSSDGQRVVLAENNGDSTTLLRLDISTGETLPIYSYGNEFIGTPVAHDEALTTFVFVSFQEEELNELYVWYEGQTQQITARYADCAFYIDPIGYTYPSFFYFKESSGNVFRFDMQTRESTWCASGVETLYMVDENGGLYFTRCAQDYQEPHVVYHPIDFVETDNLLTENDFPRLESPLLIATFYDFYYYREGAETCVARNAYEYRPEQDLAFSAWLNPDQVEPVNFSEYGEKSLEEALNRLLETATIRVQSSTDSVEFHEARHFLSKHQGYFLSLQDSDTLIYRVLENLPSQKERDPNHIWYSIPVNNGSFGEITRFEGTKDALYAPYSIRCDHMEDGTLQLYFGNEPILSGLSTDAAMGATWILCNTEFDAATGRATLCAVDSDGQVHTIARDVYCYAGIEMGEDLLYLLSDGPESYTGDLYLYRDGEHRLLETNVSIELAPDGSAAPFYSDFMNWE